MLNFYMSYSFYPECPSFPSLWTYPLLIFQILSSRVTSPNPAGQGQLVLEIVLRLVALVTVSVCHYRHGYLINVHSSTRM